MPKITATGALRVFDRKHWFDTVRAALEHEKSIPAAGRALGVSRRTIFRWVQETPELRRGLALPGLPRVFTESPPKRRGKPNGNGGSSAAPARAVATDHGRRRGFGDGLAHMVGERVLEALERRTAAQKPNGKSNGHSNGMMNGASARVHTNGKSNGHSNGHGTNGHSNGKGNGRNGRS